tara:strand:+ start:641 stop:832 length:192 start_codon:yes stop_codon:yes gene_type:complete
MLVKPEHRTDCEFIVQTLFAHEVSNLKVYNERDLIKKYYTIKKAVEKEFDGLDVERLLSSSIF